MSGSDQKNENLAEALTMLATSMAKQVDAINDLADTIDSLAVAVESLAASNSDIIESLINEREEHEAGGDTLDGN